VKRLGIMSNLVVSLETLHLSKITAVSTSINDFPDNKIVWSQAETNTSSASTIITITM